MKYTTRLTTMVCVCLLAMAACKDKKKPKPGTVTYVASLVSAGDKVTGTFTFTQAPGDPLVIAANIKGLAKGGHAVHVHVNGDCGGGFKKVGAHFMGGAKMMKGMKHAPMGDVGNIEASDKGVSKSTLTSAKLSLFKGPTSVSGRAILVHAGPDGQGKGSAGAKVACGVIEPTK